MQDTSQAYKDAVYGASRKTVARVTFDITDVTAYDDVSSQTSNSLSSSFIGNISQITDRKRVQDVNLITAETDRVKLDGSFAFADDSNAANNGEMGYTSGVLCDSGGTFLGTNLVGTLGDCETTTGWTLSGTSPSTAVDSANKLYGSNAIKSTIGTGGYMTMYKPNMIPLVDRSKYYILLADVKKGTCTSVQVKFFASGGVGNIFGNLVTSTSYGVSYAVLTPDLYPVGVTGVSVNVQTNGADGTTGYVDGVRCYEITPSDYAALSSMTAAEVGAKYPFQTTSAFPNITINFNTTHDSAGLTVTFDALSNEYATDFDVEAYNGSTLIDMVTVADNTSYIAQPLGQLLGYNKIVVTIRKWSKPFRRARVLEVDFGIVKVYADDTLVRAGLSEELDLATATIPSSEFSFTVDNSDKLFNILNPTGFYKYLQQRQKIYGELGVELTPGGVVEYLPMGQYYLSEWVSDEGSLTTSFKARTSLDLMASYDYVSLVSSSKTLHQQAVDIFTICGIVDYELPTSLQTITTNGISNKVNCKDALQMVAIAGCCNVYVKRDGTIKLVSLVDLGVVPLDDINFDNMYAEPKIQLESVVKSVEVNYFTDANTAVGSASASNPGVTEGAALKIESNTFINTSARAAAVASWVVQMKGYRANHIINWRGNPSHELGDYDSVENAFGITQTAFITKHTWSYEGYLQVNTEAKGVPN